MTSSLACSTGASTGRLTHEVDVVKTSEIDIVTGLIYCSGDGWVRQHGELFLVQTSSVISS